MTIPDHAHYRRTQNRVSFQEPLAFQVSGYPQTDLVDQLAQFILLRGPGAPKYDFPVLVPAEDTVEKQHMKVHRAAFGFRFNALPKRWTRVTAPAMPLLRVKPAFFNRAYRERNPEFGDVIVFRREKDRPIYTVKRVHPLPGCLASKKGQGTYVLGDNRHYSLDSRMFGLIEDDAIDGKVVYVILPANRFGGNGDTHFPIAFQLRIPGASRTSITTRALDIVFCVISMHRVSRAGYSRKAACTGVVTLSQRFGSAVKSILTRRTDYLYLT